MTGCPASLSSWGQAPCTIPVAHRKSDHVPTGIADHFGPERARRGPDDPGAAFCGPAPCGVPVPEVRRPRRSRPRRAAPPVPGRDAAAGEADPPRSGAGAQGREAGHRGATQPTTRWVTDSTVPHAPGAAGVHAHGRKLHGRCPAMRWKASRAVALGKPPRVAPPSAAHGAQGSAGARPWRKGVPPRARRRGRTSPGAARAGRGHAWGGAGCQGAGQGGGRRSKPMHDAPPRGGDRVRKAEGRGPGLSSRPAGGGARGKRPPPLRPPWLSGGREEWTSGGTGSTGPRACGTDTRRPPAPRPLPPQGITGCPAMRWKAPRAVAQGKPPRARRRGRTSPGAARAGRGRGGRAAGRKEAGKEGGGGANPCTTRPPAGGSSEEGRGPGPRPLLSTGGRRRPGGPIPTPPLRPP